GAHRDHVAVRGFVNVTLCTQRLPGGTGGACQPGAHGEPPRWSSHTLKGIGGSKLTPSHEPRKTNPPGRPAIAEPREAQAWRRAANEVATDVTGTDLARTTRCAFARTGTTIASA